MPDDNSGRPDEKGLGSVEYRTKLLTKLNCLIAVLEVAIAKIAKSLDVPGANEERLLKIRANLENTLSICNRAKQTLESGATASAAPRALPATRRGERPMSYRDYVELSSIDEYNKFKTLPPIQSDDIDKTDIDALIGKLFEES